MSCLCCSILGVRRAFSVGSTPKYPLPPSPPPPLPLKGLCVQPIGAHEIGVAICEGARGERTGSTAARSCELNAFFCSRISRSKSPLDL